MTKLEERTLDRQEENRSGRINAKLNADKGRDGSRDDAVGLAELRDEMNDELLNEIRAVGNARDESGAGNRYPAERQPRSESAKQQPSHAERDERELPDRGCNRIVIGLTEKQGVSDQTQGGQSEPGREIHQPLPPTRPEFLDRGENDAENERIQPAPGGVVNPGLEGAE